MTDANGEPLLPAGHRRIDLPTLDFDAASLGALRHQVADLARALWGAITQPRL